MVTMVTLPSLPILLAADGPLALTFELILMKSHYSASKGSGLESHSQMLFRTQELYLLCIYSSEKVQTVSSNGCREGVKFCQLSICDLTG